MAVCKNCLQQYSESTDATHRDFCSQSCKNLYRMFKIGEIRAS